MKRMTGPLLAVLTFTLFGWAIVQSVAQEKSAESRKQGSIAWRDSLDKAREIAAKEKKPIFMDFSAEWCGPCQEMLRTTYKDKAVVARSSKFVPVLIDVDKQSKLAERYGVQAIPTVVFLNAKGDILRRESGYHTAQEFLKILESMEKGAAQAKHTAAR